jgi:hypothetical protein
MLISTVVEVLCLAFMLCDLQWGRERIRIHEKSREEGDEEQEDDQGLTFS